MSRIWPGERILNKFLESKKIDRMKPAINTAIIIIGVLTTHFGFSQTITLGYGPAYTTTKQVVPLVNGNSGGLSGMQTAYVVSLRYEQFLPNNHCSLFTAYSKFDGYTFMFFEKEGVAEGIGYVDGVGYNGVSINRLDFGAGYRLAQKRKQFYFRPFLALGVQISKKNNEEIYNSLLNANGPSYFQLVPVSATPINTIQITPCGGFNAVFVFWRRLDVGLSFQGVLGFKPYQKMYFKYEYKGIPQATAEFEANGTGLFVTLGIGYRFENFIK